MPIDIQKTEGGPDYMANHPFGEVNMGKNLKDLVLRDFELLSDEHQRAVADYISSLRPKDITPEDTAKNARIARRLAVLKEMDALAVEIGQHWKEDIDAVELVASMRR